MVVFYVDSVDKDQRHPWPAMDVVNSLKKLRYSLDILDFQFAKFEPSGNDCLQRILKVFLFRILQKYIFCVHSIHDVSMWLAPRQDLCLGTSEKAGN